MDPDPDCKKADLDPEIRLKMRIWIQRSDLKSTKIPTFILLKTMVFFVIYCSYIWVMTQKSDLFPSHYEFGCPKLYGSLIEFTVNLLQLTQFHKGILKLSFPLASSLLWLLPCPLWPISSTSRCSCDCAADCCSCDCAADCCSCNCADDSWPCDFWWREVRKSRSCDRTLSRSRDEGSTHSCCSTSSKSKAGAEDRKEPAGP